MKAVTYLSAFMKGWAPSTIIVDEPMQISDDGSSYTLANADKRYRGSVPARVALGSSLNVPAVKTLLYTGLTQVYTLAKRMGVSTLGETSDYGPSFTLGGVDVNLMDMTYVYSVLANQGEQAGMSSVLGLPDGNRSLDPVAVTKVENVSGKTIWQARLRKERIVPANAAYLVTNVLADDRARVSMFGANSAMNLTGRPAAVKTGSSDNTRDLWAIGYTPQLVAGVWVGNANNKEMPGGTSSLIAAPIWRDFMNAALQGQQVIDFPVPDGIQFVEVCVTTGQAPTDGCPGVVREPFLAGRAPAAGEQPRGPSPTPIQETPTPAAASESSPTPTPPATTTPRVQQLTPTLGGATPTNTPRPTRTPNPGNDAEPTPAATSTPAQ
jgi:membrane peptidoglycan carboxypeptidase